jgi:CubicO group peptidase (beta-lactamase class C family)
LLLVAATIVPQTEQSEAETDRVDELIRTEIRRQRIPGLSLVVLEQGEIIKAEGYGVADRALKVPATPQTVYKIASVSKLFIATGVMSLVQGGRISLDDPIVRFLDGAPDAWSGITVRHLLSHTSGLVREGPGFDARRLQSDAEVIKSAYPLPLLFAPGERSEYSNLGYFVLADMIRRVSGQPWDEYLTGTIFRRLGMDATRVTSKTASLPNRAVGYQDNDRLLVARDWPALRPSGAFVSTVLDLAKWDAALYTSEVLRDSTRRQMWESVTLKDGTSSPYGLGWRLDSLSGHRMAYHTGTMSGFRAGFARFVDSGLTVIVLMNLDDADIESIVRGVATLYLPAARAREPTSPCAAFHGPLLDHCRRNMYQSHIWQTKWVRRSRGAPRFSCSRSSRSAPGTATRSAG